MNRARFAAAIDEAIVKATKNQTDDMKFVTTLRDYIMGLIQVQPLERTKLKAMLREFIPEGLSAFVDWLLKFIQEVGLPDNEKPEISVGSTKSRVRSTVMLAGQQPVDERSHDRGEQRDKTAGRSSLEPAHRDTASHDRNKERSRSPLARQPAARRTAWSGHQALFNDAIRRVDVNAPDGVEQQVRAIKQEPGTPDVVMMEPAAKDIKQEAAAQEQATRASLMEINQEQVPSIRIQPSNISTDAKVADTGGTSLPGHVPELYDNTSVVITNVHFEATAEQVGVFFHERCGSVMRVTILKNAHGMPKGYAYMQLASPQATQAALSLDGVQFMGRVLKVMPKLRKPPARSIPTWLFKSVSNLMPFVWGGPRHATMLGTQTMIPGHSFNRNPHRRYIGSTMVPAGAWIRGISDPLQVERDR